MAVNVSGRGNVTSKHGKGAHTIWKALVAMLVSVAAMLALGGPATAASVANGDFETGDLSGFTAANQQGSSGSWFSYSGTTAPDSGRPITAPPQGTFAATTDQNNPGSHVLYQDVALEENAEHELSFTLYYRNEAAGFSTPDTLDYNVRPNQQYRVDIMKPSADPFSVDPADVLDSVYRTEVGDPNTLEPTRITSDLSPYAGQTVRLRFAAVETEFFLRASVDDIQVTTTLQPSLSIDDETVTEGDTGPTDVPFTVSLSAASSRTVTVDFATADDTATTPSDYQQTNGTLTFEPGQTSKEVTVPVNGDTTDEPDETFFVNLSSPTNASISDVQGVGTIEDDDEATPPPPNPNPDPDPDPQPDPKPACNDGRDNDGDGKLDLRDPGCSSKTDNSENNPKPKNPNACTIKGTPGNDVLRGTNKRDVICSFGGNDVIKGLGGNDLIKAGGGNDVLYGNNGNDRLLGQGGNDVLLGGSGRDVLLGGPGKNVLIGGSGKDVERGGISPEKAGEQEKKQANTLVNSVFRQVGLR